jgi:large subunit ribosomal protein L24
MSKYKKGLKVMVISGSEKGKTSVINSVNPEKRTAIVDKINVVKRHVKPTSGSQGQIVEKEMPMHWSKLMVLGENETPSRKKTATVSKTKKASKPKKEATE